jgi:predicted acylesterase/phospholipase RssA
VRTLTALAAALVVLAGCATRPVNPSMTHADADSGYTFQTRQKYFKSQENLVVLAFSGGGTRAAAFSYGVLEFLRRTEVIGPKGNKVRLLDAVNMITGVSGGSFTALAYGLYGDKLFADYEQRFLKRDVQGELVARACPLLGRPVVDGLGPFRDGRAVVRRDPVQRRNLRRPRSRERPVHRRVGDRHLKWWPYTV